ncbi:tryptophan synthase subunit alpha [Amycolatopsis decaplanina]|uniref:tryptophan synthase n=1 Tax=Amycolatopsis decaplanina DSM 44594 TaxID=1284240 RepID=M2XW66_9PSEU|nr:tryptophan synthase subunit alpha [Amycolatopsis decaplanina]EME65206.1 putative tryptophan synthase alpha chain [Amycolatopsis decaplanina DSM 44594]
MTALLRENAATPGRLGFGVYLVPGFPDWDTSLAAVRAAVAGGADFVEFPILLDTEFSASTGGVVAEALAKAGPDSLDPRSPRLRDWLAVAPVRVGVVYRSAWPSVDRWRAGDEILSGCAGLLCEHDIRPFPEYAVRARRRGLALVPALRVSAGPVTGEERDMLESGDGFVYLALSSETGRAGTVDSGLGRRIDDIRGIRPGLPVYTAFGIRNPDDVAAVARQGADGFIVGSHALTVLGDGGPPAFERWFAGMAAARSQPTRVRT